jgi:hypothetical protein
MTMTDAITLFTFFKTTDEEKAPKGVPEPEFKPFRFPRPEAAAVRAETLVPANTAREARTLAELGVPSTLAKEFEAAFRLFGMTKGDRVTGVTFRTTDGTRYAVKTGTPAREAAEASEKAA